MKYTFPIEVNLRALNPNIDRVLSEVERHFFDMTSEKLRISYRSLSREPLLTLSVNAVERLTGEALTELKRLTIYALEHQFPGGDFKIGEPIITGVPMNLKPGTQIVYVPGHAAGNVNHPDSEKGFIFEPCANGQDYRCRYWLKNQWGTLRTRANSEVTSSEMLVEMPTGSQATVDTALARINEEAADQLRLPSLR